MRHSLSVEQRRVPPMQLFEHSEPLPPPPKRAQQTCPIAQTVESVQESATLPPPMHMPVATHFEVVMPPPLKDTQHSCVFGSQVLMPQLIVPGVPGPASVGGVVPSV